jgi:GT2 family glycosyltransferase
MLDLSIIIVNYKTPLLTERCIESIYSTIHKEISFEIIVIDNYSEDDSEKIVMKKHPEIKWINNSTNEGFGRANNIGIRNSKGNYVLLLNSDILLNNNAIERSLKAISTNNHIGVFGCQPLNSDGSLQTFTSTIASFRKLMDQNILLNYLFPAKHIKNTAIMGSFMLFPKTVLDACGYFDPDFFMYSEEIDLCHRIKKNGFQIVFDHTITVNHDNGGSTPDRTWANRQSYLSSALLFYKIHGFSGYILYHFIMAMNYFMNFFFLWKFNRKFRIDYKVDLVNYLSVYSQYFKIPFIFSRKMGNGENLLKYTSKIKKNGKKTNH